MRDDTSARTSISARITIAAAALLMSIGVMAGAAEANSTTYYNAPAGAGERKSDATRTTLNSSRALGSCTNCALRAGAHYSGGNFLYGTWMEGNYVVCKNYGVGNIGAMIETPYSAQTLTGIAGWGSGDFC